MLHLRCGQFLNRFDFCVTQHFVKGVNGRFDWMLLNFNGHKEEIWLEARVIPAFELRHALFALFKIKIFLIIISGDWTMTSMTMQHYLPKASRPDKVRWILCRPRCSRGCGWFHFAGRRPVSPSKAVGTIWNQIWTLALFPWLASNSCRAIIVFHQNQKYLLKFLTKNQYHLTIWNQWNTMPIAYWRISATWSWLMVSLFSLPAKM